MAAGFRRTTVALACISKGRYADTYADVIVQDAPARGTVPRSAVKAFTDRMNAITRERK